jgi:hypothetical protein
MGTRADFYVGRGLEARWLGSIAWDGSPETVLTDREGAIGKAKTADEFERAVTAELASRDDATLPAMGWPWPWENSNTTDFSYAFDGGQVFTGCFGDEWTTVAETLDPERERRDGKTCVFPDMSARQAVTLGRRSGVIIVEPKP